MTALFEEHLAFLCELQEIDLNLHSSQRELEGLPVQVQEIETAYETVKGEFEGARAELASVEAAKRIDETELASALDYMRGREAKLYAIKTNKEYQAALKELSEMKRQNKEREDRVLQAMERVEELNKKIAQLEKDFADKEVAYRAKKEEVAGRETEVRKKIEEYTAKRPAVAGRIDKDIIRRYDFVRRRYAVALVGISSGICQGCSTRIPPQLFNEMLRREGFKVCPSCQRLIYFAKEKCAEAGEGT